MTTKTVDSVFSEILQDNPAIEYVNPQQDPIALRKEDEVSVRKSEGASLFNFNADHNGIQCIESLRPEDRGTERQFWFSVKFLYEAFEVTDKTVRNKLERLEKLGEISNCNFLQLLLPNTFKPSTLYDLTVLNKLAMTLECDKAVEVRKAFNDVLIKHETCTCLDSYMIEDPIERAKRWIEEQAEKKRLEAERDEAIQAETRAIEASKQSFQARATAMGRLSNIADREYLAHMTETVCKKQLGILRPSRYKAEHLIGTPWMRACFKPDAYKPLRRWLTNMASRRVTTRLVSELSMKTSEASELRELYVEAKLYGVDFDTLAEERGFPDVRKVQKILASCVAVIDRYECNRGDGEIKLCPVCGYSPEIWGETLHALADSPVVGKWLRDDTSVNDLVWWIDEKSNENYGLPTI